MAHLSLELWERVDHDRFETLAYGIRERDPGRLGRRIERAFDHFADVSSMPVGDVVRRVADDRIAILLDLNGRTTHARKAIFAHRPAPVQINYLGYQGTLGAPWHDYFCVDRFGAPEALQPYFTEHFLHLPYTSFPSETRRAPSADCRKPADLSPVRHGALHARFRGMPAAGVARPADSGASAFRTMTCGNPPTVIAGNAPPRHAATG
jgi:protein O-GlcNAc transferase